MQREIKQRRRRISWKKLICLALMLVSMGAILTISWDEISQFHMVSNEMLSYVRGRVVEIGDQLLEQDSMEPDRQVGSQLLQVELLEGSHKGETVTVSNYVTRSLNVVAQVGQTLMVCVDEPENAEPYYTVFNYYRLPGLLLTVGAFVIIVLAVGRGKGAWSLLGLGYTVFVILFFLVQAIFHGWNAMLTTILTIVLSTLVSMVLLGDFGKKTLVAIAATLLGVSLSGGLFWVFSTVLHISGYNNESAESLLLISQATGMQLKPLLMVGVLITALGAVMDVAMSVASALEEIHGLNPELGPKGLMASGMRIGKDMIGTMTNTLILAYTGTALTTMLLLLAYGYDMGHLLNSDYLAMELSQSVASTGGVVLTVPAASAISAVVYHRSTRK